MPDPRQPETGLDGEPAPATVHPGDLQPPDTGSAAGQGPQGQPRGTPTQSVMKQEHKTAHESGDGTGARR